MNPILLDIPMQLETERLFLRAPGQSGDGEVVNEGIEASFPELQAWLRFAQTMPSIEETEMNMREAHIDFLKRESFRFLIFDKGTNAFIGVISFENINWEIPKCHIGYWIKTTCSGKGYMLEAAEKLAEIGLHHIKFKKIEIRCDYENLKSRSIPEKLGFELEGILKNDDVSADGSTLRDTCIYSVIPEI